MLHRPLILMFVSLSGGILIGHKALIFCQPLILLLFVTAALCLLSILFLPFRFRIACLLLMFFLFGILLNLQKHSTSQLLPLADRRIRVTIDGTVLEPPKILKEMAKLKIHATRLLLDDKNIMANENLLVTVYDNAPPLRPGEKIRFPARLRLFKNFNNPGRYDYESAMKLKGFSCAASVSDGRFIVPMGPGHLPFPLGLFEKFQRPVRDFFGDNLRTQDCALFRALILGERQGINQELREPFNQTGLGHVLAVSGLHIGLVAWLAFLLIKWILSRSYNLALKTDIRRLAALLTCLPVLAYTCLAGVQVSSQRAMIMVLAFLWSLILGREKEVWSTLAFAGLLILAIDPHALFSISFQLSFSAVIGIIWLTPVFLNKIHTPDKTSHKKGIIHSRVSDYFIGLAAVSLSAILFLLPIISYYFHRISLVTVPANITVIPILGLWIIPLGLFSAVTLPFSCEAANLFLQSAALGLRAMMEIIRFWAGLSWSDFWTITPNLYEMSMFYMLLLFIYLLRRWRWARVGIVILSILILVDVGYWTYRVHFDRHLKVTFLDVGQANSALVEFPGGKKMLIDGGGFPRDHFDVGRLVVAPYLWHSKIHHIDYLVLSHPQADHMNGLRFIACAFHPEEFWYNGVRVENAPFKELMAIVESKRIKTLLPADLIDGRQINGVNVEVLHPEPGAYSQNPCYEKGLLNNNSLVLKISFGGKSFLFPGDLERPGEEALVSNAGHALKSHVLLSPHHGSRSSSSQPFLQMVQPRICVISSGEGNFFGFPHQQTLKRLHGIGCRIIRTDQSGAVQFSVGPDQFQVRTFLKCKDIL
jgi:competence protein ComEC